MSCLPKFVTETSLYEYFSTFGQIKKVEILTSLENSPHQYAVVFSNSSRALKEICKTAEHEISSKKMKVKRLPSTDHIGKYVEHMRRTRIYVRKFPVHLNDDDLFKIFSKYGKIKEHFVKKEKKRNKLSKSAFVVYYDEKIMDILPKAGIVHEDYIILWSCFYFKSDPYLDPETLKIYESQKYRKKTQKINMKNMRSMRNMKGKIEDFQKQKVLAKKATIAQMTMSTNQKEKFFPKPILMLEL